MVTAGEKGRALATDLSRPVFYRLGYAEGTKELYLAADVALTREKPSASFAVCEFAFDGRQGMRGAVARYSERFPQAAQVRAKRHGLWMPFFSISKVQGWEDFGFAFKEGIDEPAWDDDHEVITFRYTEPMTWWMAMPKELPRTMEAAVEHARGLVAKGDRDAAAWESSSFRNAEGKIPGRIRKEPWCDGIVWSMNSAPGIDGRSHFQTKWSAAIRQNPGGRTPGRIDGEYIDSVEGYVTDDLDFRREHFAAMQTPLVFDPVTHKPAIYKGFIAYEYVRQIAEDCHADGKLTMANGTPGNWPWIPVMIDVMGTETDWKPRGVWTPMSIEDMQYRRAMAGGKPYCYLMNTDFEQFSHADAERYMKRCAAFAFFPGFFSHNAAEEQYFSQSALYNRDRELFKRYVPVIRRLSEAGWRPVSEARSSDAGVLVEQFGDRCFTVINAGSERRTAEILLPAGTASATNQLTGASVLVVEGRMQVTLDGEDVLVVEAR